MGIHTAHTAATDNDAGDASASPMPSLYLVESHQPSTPSPASSVCELSTWEHFVENDGSSDIEAETRSVRDATARRLEAQSAELKRFHDQICRRVSERERMNREMSMRDEKQLMEKYARLVNVPGTHDYQSKATTVRPNRLCNWRNEKLRDAKEAVHGDCSVLVQLEKVLRYDAQTCEVLLVSKHLDRTPCFQNVCGDNEPESRVHARAIQLKTPDKARLFAAVRRSFMEQERAAVHAGDEATSRQHKSTLPIGTRKRVVAPQRSRRRQTRPSPTLTGRTLVVDVTDGCEVRAHKQTSLSSTPWRKPTNGRLKVALSTGGTPGRTSKQAHERYLHAIQNELGTPALCSCARNLSTSPFYQKPCANNCVFYRQPKKKEKLLHAVCKQNQ
ncbi:TPA: hypothetical protein N0F65_000089 [Lagenidium giganteum]|uniref:Uncharacterized protein n=1 Tax=Lagenidium giganteum TaxID=4803 RepID=A0AAV2YP93_9STRA|nr:TPA: hypothetical protein N0F65_000089 [Lagenidium giganteum]